MPHLTGCPAECEPGCHCDCPPPTDCPCTTDAPAHAHSVGGYAPDSDDRLDLDRVNTALDTIPAETVHDRQQPTVHVLDTDG